MARLGCFLELLSMAALFLLVVLPVLPFFEKSEFFDNLLKPVICPDGTIRREQYQTYDDDDGTGYSMNVFCVDNEEQETDITWQWFGIGMAGFLVPFLIGLVLMITGFNRGVRGMVGGMPQVQGYDGYSPSIASAAMSVPQPKSLSERLKELEDARRQGLLTDTEYQLKREDILNS